MTTVGRIRPAMAASGQPRKPETGMQPFRQESIAVGSDCAVLQITGEVDVYTAPLLREQVVQLVNSGVRHIIADLRGVDLLDSTGLGALVGSLKRLRTHDGSFKVVASGGRTLRTFQITGLTRAFALHPSVLDAMTTDEHWQTAVTGEGHDTEEWCRKHGLL
jgi:anti-sigma B factor antagonist